MKSTKASLFRSVAPFVSLAGTLCLIAPAHAIGDRGGHQGMRHMRLDNPGMSNREIRQLTRNFSDANRQQTTPLFQPQNLPIHHDLPLNGMGHRLTRFNGQSAFLTENGRARAIVKGLELDLTSSQRSIVLGDNLFSNGRSYTIRVGGEEQTLTSGSKVSAAEYVALQQVLNGGSQALTVDQAGRGVDGQFSLNSISDGGRTIRAAELVIPENVTASGDFARHADGVRVTNDLVNYGTINAFSSNRNTDTVRIAARDINNNAGASLSSELNLSLKADRDINNSGSISSGGDIELSAGRSINNHGFINSNRSITLNGNTDADLLVNNTGGTISALNGAINVRSSDYNGIGNSTVSGGNLYSRELNLFTGLGTTDVIVNQLSGVVHSSGTAAHVSANTDTLTIGSQCLLGDPTYYNTGTIVIAGNILIGEKLAIIAGGDITSGLSNLTIATRDGTGQAFDINMIAGADVVAGSGQVSPNGGPAALPTQPPLSQNTTADVTFSTNSLSGGNIDLTGVTTNLLIDSSSNKTNFDGGNITLAAFADASGNKGRVLLPTTSATINASGDGTGKNGDILIVAGGRNVLAIKLPSNTSNIINNVGTNTSGGNVSIVAAQPSTSDGQPITFDTNGAITTGNTISSTSLSPGALIELGNIQMGPSQLLVLADGDIQINGNVDVVGTATGTAGGKIVVTGFGSFTQTGRMSVNGADGQNAGSISVLGNSATPFSIDNLTAQAALLGGNGGDIKVQNLGTGGINLAKTAFGTILANAPAGDGGSISLNADVGQLVSLTDVTVNASGSNTTNNGFIGIVATDLAVVSGSLELRANNGINGGISIGTTTGGITVGGNKFTALSTGILDLLLAQNLIDANNLLGKGGTIDIEGTTLVTHNTGLGFPLVIRASGTNADGGTILYADFSTTPTFIGNGPDKLPKGPVNFLQMEAVAFSNGAGGSISALAGGTLRVSDGALLVTNSSTGGPQNGGTIQLAGNVVLAKKGSVVIEDSLDVSGINGGNGGTIFLVGNSKKDFVVSFNPTKPPKHGTAGQLTAIGAIDGNITVQNFSGGVQVGSLNAILGGVVTLQAGAKGKVTEAKSVVLASTKTVTAISDDGAINLVVNTPNMSFQSDTGKVTMVDNFSGSTKLLTSIAGNDATVQAGGALQVTGSIDVTGDLKISTIQNALRVSSFITVTNGSLTIENDDTALGTIDIDAFLSLQTKGPQGDVVNIVIGPVPKKPVNPSPPFPVPSEFITTPTGKGQVFFGVNPNGIVTAPFNQVTLVAKNTNLVLNNASSVPATNKITFGNLVTITADPPDKTAAMNMSVPTFASVPPTNESISNGFNKEASSVRTYTIPVQAFDFQTHTTLPTDLLSTASSDHSTTTDLMGETAELRKGAILFAPFKQ